MNRLVIIGNGFDLAHGMKTSYMDFIEDYLCNAFVKCFEDGIYEDILISFNQEMAENVFKEYRGYKVNTTSIRRILHDKKLHPNIKIKSDFFNDLILNVESKNWVDVEYTYFNILKQIALSVGTEKKLNLLILNEEFSFFKNNLIEYISKILKSNKFEQNERISEIIKSISPELPRNLKRSPNGKVSGNLRCFLNFNYTDTYKKYMDRNDSSIDIHGQIEDSIIFGWGDDIHEDYAKIENLNDNNYLINLKSVKYIQTNEHSRLMSFIDSSDFKVFIVGHSCGLSDRTMLKTIFESNNCKRIQLYYYKKTDGTDDFTEKGIEILRHFSDKSQMRRKVVSKDLSSPM